MFSQLQDKVEAVMDDSGDVAGDGVDGEEEEEEMEPVGPLPEPPDDGGPVGWPMPEFCPLTVSDLTTPPRPSQDFKSRTNDEMFVRWFDQIDGTLKESFVETIRKDAERPPLPPPPQEEADPEVMSPDSRPSSSKRHRAGTASPSSRSPYRNILQVFQQCRQD